MDDSSRLDFRATPASGLSLGFRAKPSLAIVVLILRTNPGTTWLSGPEFFRYICVIVVWEEQMEPTSNDVGNAWMLFVLGQLSEAWPRRVDFDVTGLSTKTGIAPILESEVEETFADLFRWLKSEGFVEYSHGGEGWVVDVAITTKAMDAIGHALPTAKKGAGTYLKRIAVSAGSTAGQALIAETIGQVIGAAARSFLGASS